MASLGGRKGGPRCTSDILGKKEGGKGVGGGNTPSRRSPPPFSLEREENEELLRAPPEARAKAKPRGGPAGERFQQKKQPHTASFKKVRGMQQKERGTSSAIKMSCVAFEFSFFFVVCVCGEVSRRRRVFLGREWGGGRGDSVCCCGGKRRRLIKLSSTHCGLPSSLDTNGAAYNTHPRPNKAELGVVGCCCVPPPPPSPPHSSLAVA